MSNKEIYQTIFQQTFSAEVSNLNEKFSKDQIDNWDSLRQLSLTSAIEESFDILLDAEDIIGFNSYIKGIEILKKYAIEL